ncbi:MFS transporter [Asanoa ishikariensis]|uniref:Multidrug efflux pump Tap n=1 Tax=Asanoa ishikariensis TaxID=137265 RepID=A0A1H3T6G1_9ACTN|nr:MFS transporter [Asanoa ishikariensis]GIF62923.1 MFS transporter [Asanoa ishikariensis]SDZ45943.1 Fucose permease [Asanoa ishikariensis]
MSRRPALVALLTADTISAVGTRMSALALPWFVLVSTGSPSRAGVVAFVEMLPYVLAAGAGGPLIDRIGGRRFSIVADAVSALAIGAIPLLHDRIGFGGLLVLVGIAGGLRGFSDTAKEAIFPRVARESGMEMTRAASLQDGLHRLATLLGAPAGGALIAVLDAPTVLLFDAATFAVAAALVLLLVRVPPAEVPVKEESYRLALRAGIVFVRRDRLAGAIIVMMFATNLFDAAYNSVLLPMWATLVGSSVVLGLASGSFAIGAVLGNIVFTAYAPRAPRWALFTVGFIVGGAPRFLAAGFSDEVWLLYAVSFAAGLGIAAINPILGAILYERVPEHMMARVQGVLTAVAWAGIPLGGLLGGAVAGVAGVHVALIGTGVLYLAVTLLPLVRPVWRELDVRPSVPSPRVAEDSADLQAR